MADQPRTINFDHLSQWLLEVGKKVKHSCTIVFHDDGSGYIEYHEGNDWTNLKSFNNLNELNELITPPTRIRDYTIYYTSSDGLFCFDTFKAADGQDAISQCLDKHPSLYTITGCDLGSKVI